MTVSTPPGSETLPEEAAAFLILSLAVIVLLCIGLVGSMISDALWRRRQRRDNPTRKTPR